MPPNTRYIHPVLGPIFITNHVRNDGTIEASFGELIEFDDDNFRVMVKSEKVGDVARIHVPPTNWVTARSSIVAWSQDPIVTERNEKRYQTRAKPLEGFFEEAKNLDTSQLAVSDEEDRAAKPKRGIVIEGVDGAGNVTAREHVATDKKAPAAPKRGKFIVIEGTDGAGTSTQRSMLRQWLLDHGVPTISTHEPTGSRIGALIRQALTKQVSFEWDALALLFAADRVDHCRTVIEPALAEGKWVVSDRGWLSSLIYQTLTSNCSPREGVHRFTQPDQVTDWVRQINLRMLKPDVAFVLAVAPEVAAARRRKRSGKSELFEEGDVADSIAEAYMTPGRWGRYLSPQQGFDTLDGELSESAVHDAIIDRVSRLVQEWKKQ